MTRAELLGRSGFNTLNGGTGQPTVDAMTAGRDSGIATDPTEIRARALMAGQYVPSQEDMVTAATYQIPGQFSEANMAAQANMAANGLAGSGFQDQRVKKLRQDQTKATADARRGALQQWNQTKNQQFTEGANLQENVEDRRLRKQALELSQQQAEAQRREAREDGPFSFMGL